MPSERVFSVAGNVLTKKRNRLGASIGPKEGKLTNMLIVMNSNKNKKRRIDM